MSGTTAASVESGTTAIVETESVDVVSCTALVVSAAGRGGAGFAALEVSCAAEEVTVSPAVAGRTAVESRTVRAVSCCEAGTRAPARGRGGPTC